VEQEVQNLRELPLSDLMKAPIEAAIAAQASSATTTANFIQQVGFENQANAKHSIFDILSGGAQATEQFKLRTADLTFRKKRVKDDLTVEEVDEKLSLPLLTLFNIPSFEIKNLNWSFNVRLKKMEALETELTSSTQVTTTSNNDFSLDLKKLGLHIGSSLKVEASNKTDFALRYGLGREHEYNLQIAMEAGQGPTPPGISKLLAIAEKIAAAEEEAVAAEAKTTA